MYLIILTKINNNYLHRTYNSDNNFIEFIENILKTQIQVEPNKPFDNKSILNYLITIEIPIL